MTRFSRSSVRLLAVLLLSLTSVFAQEVTVTPTSPSVVTQEKRAVEIISFKIGNNYYPLLDRQSSVFSAEATDIPQTEAEKVARRNAQTNRNNSTYNQNTPRGIIAPEDKRERRAQGQLRTTVRVIDMAEWVNLSIKNTSDKAIKAIEWDFAFPRLEGDKVVLRYDVSNKVDIKPGGKKTLKYPLPQGAMKCKVVAINDGKAFESVCSKSFQDPSQFPQEPVSIKKIEYADGIVWQR